MNYRHAFHAGNFADLVKHAAILTLIDSLCARSEPLRVVDTHAGRGMYDVGGEDAARSGEAKAGIGRISQSATLPEGLSQLWEAVQQINAPGAVRLYPGSPHLIASRLRAGDSYIACELRPEEHAALAAMLRGRSGVRSFAKMGSTMQRTYLLRQAVHSS